MNKQDGFSLIELAVTLAIAAIVFSIGIPSFQSYVQNNRKAAAISDLATALQLARSTAISRRVPVTLCISSNGAACQTGTGSDWSQGWMIYVDTNGDNTLNAGEEILRIHAALPDNSTLIGSGSTANRVSFKPQGLADGTIGTITHCDSRGASYANALVISFGGQVRQAIDTNGDGIVENGSGGPVPCPS